MDDATLKAIIGGVAAVVGAVIGGLVTAYNARQKLREIEINHSHQLHQEYLASAREYTKSVYVPLSVAVTSLTLEYLRFRKDTSSAAAKSLFRDRVEDFRNSINEMLNRGMSAFLTTELESLLLSFVSFLEESDAATEPVRKVVLTIGIKLMGLNQDTMREVHMQGERQVRFWQGRFGFSQLGISMGFRGEQILAAPLESDLFEERFMQDSTAIKLLIKEVTLGSHARTQAET